MGSSKGRVKAWFNKKITDPLLQILRRFVFSLSLSLRLSNHTMIISPSGQDLKVVLVGYSDSASRYMRNGIRQISFAIHWSFCLKTWTMLVSTVKTEHLSSSCLNCNLLSISLSLSFFCCCFLSVEVLSLSNLLSPQHSALPWEYFQFAVRICLL